MSVSTVLCIIHASGSEVGCGNSHYLTIPANRLNAVDFTVPLMSFKRVMLYRPSGQNFTSVSQALESGNNVGVIQGGSTSKALMTSSVNSSRILDHMDKLGI